MVIQQPHRLSRTSHGCLGGVCEGLGRHYGVNPTLLRLGWLAAFFVGGTGLFLYLILWAVLPREDSIPEDPTVWITGPDGVHRPPLHRTTIDRKIFGVCGGIARRWDFDPSLVRLAVLSSALLSFGVTVLIYLGATLVLPTSPHLIADYSHSVDL